MKKNDPANWQYYWECTLCAILGGTIRAILAWLSVLGYSSPLGPVPSLLAIIDTVLTGMLIATVIPALLASRNRWPNRFARTWVMTYAMLGIGVLTLALEFPAMGLCQMAWGVYTAYRLKQGDDVVYPTPKTTK